MPESENKEPISAPLSSSMTSRERLLASMQCRTTDRIAVSPFIHNNFVRYYFRDPMMDDETLLFRTIDLYSRFGFDMIHRNMEIRFSFEDMDDSDWQVKCSVEHDDTIAVETTFIKTPERTLRQIVRYDKITTFLRVKSITEHFIKDREDFRQFTRYMPALPENPRMAVITRSARLIGERGITAPWTFGLFNFVAEMRKLENLLMDMLLDESLYHDMMQFFSALLTDFYRQVNSAGVDAVSYPGNLANGVTVGEDFFNTYILPYEKNLIDGIQAGGAAVIYHNCGNARALINSYNTLHMRCFETLTRAPHGDMDIPYACKTFSPDIALMGNIDQIDVLTRGTPEEVANEVQSIIDAADGRKGFILGTSDFLEEGTPSENLAVIMKTVLANS